MTNNFFVCIFRVSLVVGRLAGKKNWPLLLLCIRNAILLLASTWPRTVAPEAHSAGRGASVSYCPEKKTFLSLLLLVELMTSLITFSCRLSLSLGFPTLPFLIILERQGHSGLKFTQQVSFFRASTVPF